MSKRKDILTTGQVAQICKVAPRTVTKWFDSGRLKGYRIPGGRDRRIPAGELLRFMKTHNIPTDGIEKELGRIRVLIIDSDWQMANTLAETLTAARSSLQTATASNSFDAGLVAHKFAPHVILINLMAKSIDADTICRNVRANEELASAKVIAVADGLPQNDAAALLRKGYDSYILHYGDIKAILCAIDQATAIVY